LVAAGLLFEIIGVSLAAACKTSVSDEASTASVVTLLAEWVVIVIVVGSSSLLSSRL
jgi:hypothetical protein